MTIALGINPSSSAVANSLMLSAGLSHSHADEADILKALPPVSIPRWRRTLALAGARCRDLVRRRSLFAAITVLLFLIAFGEDLILQNFDGMRTFVQSISHRVLPGIVPAPVPLPKSSTLSTAPSHLEQTFIQGVVQSLVASVWFAWALYTFRAFIKRIFQPQIRRLRSPISTAVTPIIFGKTKSIWDENDVPIEVEFRNTGRKALDDLRQGACEIAIAGDYAICAFLQDIGFARWPDERYKLLPFARMKNQVKLLVPPNASPTLDKDGLQGQQIAFWPHSIHDEFLAKIGLKCSSSATADTSLLHFLSSTSSGSSAGCVVVEPYYIAFEHAQYREIDAPTCVDWYMCMVLKESLFARHPELERRLKRAIREACNASETDWENAIRSCADYVLQEFTGISAEDLIKRITRDSLSFKVPSHNDFTGRLNELFSTSATRDGASILLSNPDCIII